MLCRGSLNRLIIENIKMDRFNEEGNFKLIVKCIINWIGSF